MSGSILWGEAEDGATAPPKPPFAISVGVTGHRRTALPEDLEPLRRECRHVLRLVKKLAEEVHAEDSQWFSASPPLLRLLSPLAEGADQIVAEVALEFGFELHAVLPFGREHYRSTLDTAADRDAFDDLINRASRVLELPGEPSSSAHAYELVGRATVAHCDLLVALWDGALPRGRGGTAEVVELAIRRGVAVAHVDHEGAAPTRLLWGGFDPTVVTEKLKDTVQRAFDRDNLGHYFLSIFSAPRDESERDFIRTFSAERVRRFRTRIEYPLLLAVAGVAPFNHRAMRESYCNAWAEEEWEAYRQNCAEVHEVEVSLDVLGSPYGWSDRLASRLAQTYRSGHILNFVLGGIAVCTGLVANILSEYLLQFSLVEAAVTALILVNTSVGVRQEWHRRWLDYRQLAERLRPMRSLKLLGVAAPDPPGTSANPTPQRWTEWYALAVWRAMGCPSARIDPDRAMELSRAVAAHEVAPQVAYHHKHARQIALLDHRLERISVILFWVTLLVSCAGAIGAALRPHLLHELHPWLTLVGAGIPAIGTAVFGIRYHADFGGSAVRSENTANALSSIDSELAQGVPLDRAADLTEQAARVMLADVDAWRLVNQQQELDLL